MRYTFFIAALLLLIACAPVRKIVKQEYPSPFQFELVDTVNADKNYIFVKAHEWISKTYGSAKTVIDMQDKEAGKLIGKAQMTVKIDYVTMYGPIVHTDVVRYIMSIDCKDGKYRCRISDFYHEGGGFGETKYQDYGSLDQEAIYVNSGSTGKPVESKTFYEVKNQAMYNAKVILADLKKAMHQKDEDF
ncbi:MAG TPA: DUF4468 domain-containing protein [Roseivirga sp.]